MVKLSRKILHLILQGTGTNLILILLQPSFVRETPLYMLPRFTPTRKHSPGQRHGVLAMEGAKH